MTNPWVQWWQDIQLRMSVLTVGAVQVQLLAFALALVATLILDRLLERYRERWLGGPPQEHSTRAVLWSAKFPVLVLLYRYLVLSIYTITDQPAYTLGKLVTL